MKKNTFIETYFIWYLPTNNTVIVQYSFKQKYMAKAGAVAEIIHKGGAEAENK